MITILIVFEYLIFARKYRSTERVAPETTAVTMTRVESIPGLRRPTLCRVLNNTEKRMAKLSVSAVQYKGIFGVPFWSFESNQYLASISLT